jgi:hypothetical protein
MSKKSEECVHVEIAEGTPGTQRSQNQTNKLCVLCVKPKPSVNPELKNKNSINSTFE